MAQFVNPYNDQNGMMSSPGGIPRRDGPPPRYNPNWEQQNWRPYNPEPIPQPIPILGRWVNDANEIMPKEVDMNGQLYFFPKSDYSCIYAKVWSQDGRLLTYRFLPEKVKSPEEYQQAQCSDVTAILNDFMSAVNQRLDEFERSINGTLLPFTNKDAAKPRPKKTETE